MKVLSDYKLAQVLEKLFVIVPIKLVWHEPPYGHWNFYGEVGVGFDEPWEIRFSVFSRRKKYNVGESKSIINKIR